MYEVNFKGHALVGREDDWLGPSVIRVNASSKNGHQTDKIYSPDRLECT